MEQVDREQVARYLADPTRSMPFERQAVVRQLLTVLSHNRFRGLWFCRFAGMSKERVWYVTFLDADGDFSETTGDTSWLGELQSGIDAIRKAEENA